MLKFASICPHPPLLIPSIGQNNLSGVNSTVMAMKKIGNQIKDIDIETIVIISPHGPFQSEFMTVISEDVLRGDFLDFGSDVSMEFRNDIDLGLNIKKAADSKEIPVEIMKDGIYLDHGAMVPLYYLAKHMPNVEIVPISFSDLDYEKHFEFGEAVHEAIVDSGKRIALVASGDLSHRLTPNAPAGYSPSGKKFDESIVRMLENNEVGEVLRMDSDLIEDAGECGLRSIIILLGALSGTDYKFKKLSYEGPYGVGYLVGKFELDQID